MPEPRRRPGRPRLHEGEESTPVNIRVVVSDYDRACEIARRARVSVPEVFRRAFARSGRMKDDNDHE